jgi:hypothetical protein
MPKYDEKIHKFDVDGESVLFRTQLERENAILLRENEELKARLKTLARRLSRDSTVPQPAVPTLH